MRAITTKLLPSKVNIEWGQLLKLFPQSDFETITVVYFQETESRVEANSIVKVSRSLRAFHVARITEHFNMIMYNMILYNILFWEGNSKKLLKSCQSVYYNILNIIHVP